MIHMDVQDQYQKLLDGYRREPFPSLKQRADRLRRIEQLLLNHEGELCEAVNQDFSFRSAGQTAFADITTTIKSARHGRQQLKYWMRDQRRSADLSLRLGGASAYSNFQPKGVVGIISPWNFPINLSLSPMISALAAGNRVLLKPSEMCPRTSELLQQLLQRYFAEDEVAVALGGADCAEAVCALPLDHLLYTGSTAIGRKIAAQTAENLTPLTLELGGKSPVIAGNKAKLKVLAEKLAFGKYFNAGQVCIAPDYLLASREQIATLIPLLQQAINRLDGNPSQNDAVGLIDQRQEQRLDSLLSECANAGAQIHQLRGVNGFTLQLIVDPPANSRIHREEIFGPLLLVNSIDSFEDGVDYIADRPQPLAIYYFGTDAKERSDLLTRTRSGALVENDIVFQYANDELPFGGMGESGQGRYRGRAGFECFSNERAVYRAGVINTGQLVLPPYRKTFQVLNHIMRKL